MNGKEFRPSSLRTLCQAAEASLHDPYFKIEPDVKGQFQAKLYGANHEPVWLTEAHPAKADAKNAITLLRAYAKVAVLKY